MLHFTHSQFHSNHPDRSEKFRNYNAFNCVDVAKLVEQIESSIRNTIFSFIICVPNLNIIVNAPAFFQLNTVWFPLNPNKLRRVYSLKYCQTCVISNLPQHMRATFNIESNVKPHLRPSLHKERHYHKDASLPTVNDFKKLSDMK